MDDANAMDRTALIYKGLPPNHTCCDQALRILPNGEWIVVFMTGGRTIASGRHGQDARLTQIVRWHGWRDRICAYWYHV